MSKDYGAAKPRRTHREFPYAPGGRLTFEQEDEKRRLEEEEWAAKSGPVTVRYKDMSC